MSHHQHQCSEPALKEGDEVIVPKGATLSGWDGVNKMYATNPTHDLGRILFTISDGYAYVKTLSANGCTKFRMSDLIKV